MRTRALIAGVVTAVALPLVAAEPATAQEPDADEYCPEEVTTLTGENLYDVAERCGVDIVELRRMNPEIADPRVIPVGTEIRIPARAGEEAVGAVEEPEAAEPAVPAEPAAAAAGTRFHTVAAGETLRAIADRYEVTIGDLLRLNAEITDPNVIHTGQRIQLPTDAAGNVAEIEPAADDW